MRFISKNKFNFKLKGTRPIQHHLGADFNQDPDGILQMSPTKYIKQMVAAFKCMFGDSLLEQGDHLKFDTTHGKLRLFYP